jgi:tetratricopeptide (TPR) repeat protein
VKRSWAIFVIVAATALSYAPAVNDGFVWDDTALILRDPLIRSWRLVPEGFNHFLFVDATASDFYRPIQRLTYTLEYAAFAFRPLAYHVTNVILHAAAAVAFFFLAEELLGLFGLGTRERRWASAIASVVWAVHPVQSAAVVYISGRADPLSALFGFLGCYLLLRSGTAEKRSRAIWLTVLSAAALLLAALSKESGLIFCIIALALSIWTRGIKAATKTLVPVLFVVAVYLSLRLPAEHTAPPKLSRAPALATRPITVARAMAEYAGLILLPVNLHMDREVNAQPKESVEASFDAFAWRELQTLLGILIIGGLIYWAVVARKREPATFRFLVLAALAYLPVSGIVPLNASVAEHWIYLPTAFLFVAAAVQLQALGREHAFPLRVSRGLTIILGCWMIFLAGRTALRTRDWKDQRTFLEETIADGGDSARMWINLAGLELSEGHLDRAKSALGKALQKEPDQPLAVLNLAVVALRQKDFKTARSLATRASNMPWVKAQAYELLAVIDFQQNGTANPLRLRLASRTGPSNWEIEKRYVRLMDELGGTDSAINELQTTLRTEWYRAESWDLLEQLLRKRGKMTEASWANEEAFAYDVHLDQHRVRL